MKYSRLYFQFLLRVLFLSACCVLSAEKSWAVTCNAIFTNGIQATGAAGNINLSYHSILTGGSATLATKTLTDNTSWVACSGASCVASGTAAPTSPVAFQTSTGANGNINIAYQGSQTVNPGNYGTVSVGQEASLNFSTNDGIYKMGAVTTSFKSIVSLVPGDYWINGNLNLAQETILRRANASGSVRIFVNGNVNLGFKVSTDQFLPEQLLIYATGNITGDNETKLSTFIYAGGNVSFNYQSVITGAISGANFTASGNEVKVNYQSSSLAALGSKYSFEPFCGVGVAAPVLLGSWRMDQLSWNGTAGEVLDSSGQNNHGRARIAAGSTALPSTTSGSPAYSSGAQSTCRYGLFDGTANGVTRTYGYVELSGFPTLPNGFTFAAWIRSTNAGAQHQRILVRDDAQNGWGLSLADGTGQPKLRFFARNITNNGAVTGQGTDPSCGVFCVDTNAVLTNNAWYYVASVVDTTAKTVTLYVYSASGVLQAKATGAYSGTWTDGTGTAAIGGESSASSEGQQTSWHFLGNIDEVNIYSGALTQTGIEGLLPSVRTCPAPDHYELDMAASSLACMGADVTVRACADSVSPCSNIDYTVNGNVTLAASAGTLNSASLSLVSGSGTAKLLYPTAPDNTNATVTLSGEATLATNSRKCCVGGSCSVANSCTTNFKQAGFVFSNTLSGAQVNIPNQVAGKLSAVADGNMAYLRALQSNTTTGACTARFTTPQTVKLAYKCVNPSTCILGETLLLNGTAVQANANAASPVVYSDVNLIFDANGSAPIPINYSDVGQVQLLASLFLPAASGNPDYTLTGVSNLFVVSPHSVKVSAVTTAGNVNNPGKTSEIGAANNFVSAGTPFKVSVQSLNQSLAVTPNFGRETSSQSQFITLVTNSLVYPASGTKTALTYTPNTFTPASPASLGTYTNPTVVWPQVGSMTIMPGLSDYLNTGSVAGAVSSTIGRFYPDHYRVVPASTSAANGCTSFSYMGQPNLQIKPYILAESAGASPITVTNYDNNTLGYGGTAALTLPVYAAENNSNGTSLSSRLSVTTGKWIDGVYNNANNALTGTFSRQVSGAPEAPFTSLRIGASGMIDSSATPFDIVGVITNTPAAAAKDMLGATAIAFKDPSDATKYLLNLRYGRLRLDDAFGPETVSLPVNFVTEYWTGTYFSFNTNDSCTMIPRNAITYPAGTLATDANRNVSVGGGTSQGNYTGLFGLGVQFSAGLPGVPDATTRLSHYFTAPNAQGRFVVGVNLTDLPWLRFDWNQDGNFSDVSLPNATIEFGSYRGNDRVIYWRERLQ